MSLFGSLMGDFDDDLFMGNHMNAMNQQMRSMNRLMNSLMPDPFNMLTPFDTGFQQNALMERGNPHAGNPMGGLFGFPAMPNINRLLSADIGSPNGASYCSSSVITMSPGPDGRPQIYQATTSTKTGPNGIRETRKTVEDSRRGMKKMAIGHHIGDRAHIIEKEQDLRSGQLEERQEFINLDEEEAETFDREFTNRARMGGVRGARPQEMITIESADDDDDVRPRHYSRHGGSGGHHRRAVPAITAPPQQQQNSSTTSSIPSSAADVNVGNNNKNVNGWTNLHSDATTKSTATNSNNNNNNVNNSNNSYYTSNSMRRSSASVGTGYHHPHNRGISARRPLRTPPSSPLATTPTNHSYSTATSTSVHPHPYNASAARRNYRSKHTKQHQQPHQPQPLTITEIIDDDDEEEQQQPTATAEPTAVIEEEEDDDVAAEEGETVINPAATAAAAAAASAKTTSTKSHTSKH